MDNVTLNLGAGGDTIGADDVGGVKYQIVKLATGADGVMTPLSNAAPLPISDAGGALTVDDGGGSITVDGTLTIQDGGGSITIDGAVTVSNTVTVDGSGVTQPVSGTLAVSSITTSLTPGTSAAHLGKAEDAAAGSGDTGVMALAVRRDTVASSSGTDGDYSTLNVNASGRLYVSSTVDAALPAGTNNIGDVDIASAIPAGTNNIGDVDVLTMPATFAEDSAHTSTDLGVQILGVRRDANTTLVGTDGDYAPFQVDANGSLKVAIISGAGSGGTAATDDAAFTAASGSGTPIMGFVTTDAVDSGDVGVVGMTATRSLYTSIRTPLGDSAMDDTNDAVRVNIVAGAGSGGTSMTDDAAFTPGSTGINPMGAMFDDVTPDSVNEGDGGVVRMSANRNLYVTLRDAAGNERGLNIDASGFIAVTDGGATLSIDDGAGSLTVDGTVAVSSITTAVVPGTAATNLGKAEDAVHASGDTGVMALGVRRDTPASGAGADGDYATLNLSSGGRLYTSATLDTAIPAGTNNIGDVDVLSLVPGTGATALGKAIDTAAGATDTGVAFLAVRDDALSTLTPVEGDYVPLRTTSTGALWVEVSNGLNAIAEDTASAGGEDGIAVLAVRRDSATSGVSADGDFANLSVDSTGALRVTGGTAGTQYAEDAAAVSGDTGTMALAVRRDTVAVGSGTDGDYSTLNVNASGRLYTSATVDAALPAGTNNIGDVDVLTAPGTFAEDAAHSSGQTGYFVMGVRRDANTTFVSADGDYSPFAIDANGSLKVAIISGAGSGGTSIADSAAFTVATTSVTPVAGIFDDVTPDSVSEGDAGALRMSANRNLYSTLRDAAGNERGANVNASSALLVAQTGELPAGNQNIGDVDVASLPALAAGSATIGSIAGITTSIVPGTAATNLGKAEDAAAASGDTGVAILVVRQDSITGSTSADGDYGMVKADSAGRVYVNASGVAVPITDNSGSLTVDNAGTFAVQADSVIPGTGATNLGKAEDGAHTSGDVGVFALAVRTDTLAASSGTTGDYEALHTDSIGALWVRSSGELADDAAFTPATSRVKPAGFFADESSTDSVDEGDIGAARITLDRKQIVTEYVHAAAGGTSAYNAISAAAVLSAVIKASPGKVFSIQIFNVNAAARFVRLYNQTGAPGTGDTANILWRGIIPGNTAGAGFVVPLKGMQFSAGIGIRASAAVADNDATALAANEQFFNVEYV